MSNSHQQTGGVSSSINAAPSKNNHNSRLSTLSKLNLLGLIDLSLITTNLKLTKDVDQAMKSCEDSIGNLKFHNTDTNLVGIASQNLIEDLLDNLHKIKEKDLDIEDIAISNNLVTQTTTGPGTTIVDDT